MKVVGYRSKAGYGWSLTLVIAGRDRVRWNSTKATSRMRPGFSRGADEHCNRAVTFMAWPLGHLDVWWEPRSTWRTHGRCEDCTAYCAAEGVCVECSSRPCWCEELATGDAA